MNLTTWRIRDRQEPKYLFRSCWTTYMLHCKIWEVRDEAFCFGCCLSNIWSECTMEGHFNYGHPSQHTFIAKQGDGEGSDFLSKSTSFLNLTWLQYFLLYLRCCTSKSNAFIKRERKNPKATNLWGFNQERLGRESKQMLKTSIEINCDYRAKLLGRETLKNWRWQMNILHFEQARAGRASN